MLASVLMGQPSASASTYRIGLSRIDLNNMMACTMIGEPGFTSLLDGKPYPTQDKLWLYKGMYMYS